MVFSSALKLAAPLLTDVETSTQMLYEHHVYLAALSWMIPAELYEKARLTVLMRSLTATEKPIHLKQIS